MTMESKMSQTEQHLEPESEIKEAGVKLSQERLEPELSILEVNDRDRDQTRKTKTAAKRLRPRPRPHFLGLETVSRPRPWSRDHITGVNDLQIRLELARIALETKKLDLETQTMQCVENDRAREHDIQMYKLKKEEMKAQEEIEKQRFEERQLVMKEIQNKLDENEKKLTVLQAQLLQAKGGGKGNVKDNVLACLTIATTIINFITSVKAALST